MIFNPSQYGKLTKRNYSKAKSAYVFDSYLRNFLQEILERIEIFEKSTSDAITLGYDKAIYIFEDDELYYNESKNIVRITLIGKILFFKRSITYLV